VWWFLGAGFGGLELATVVAGKCGAETALVVHEFLTERGLRDASEISLVMPLGTPILPSPDASAASS
jgi:hypothetical protein